MKKLLAQLAVASALAITAATAVTVGHAAADDDGADLASITLVHGVPDLLVDIYVNGGAPIEDVSFTTVATVPGEKGKNTVAIRAANAPANSAALLTRSFYLRKNQSKTRRRPPHLQRQPQAHRLRQRPVAADRRHRPGSRCAIPRRRRPWTSW